MKRAILFIFCILVGVMSYAGDEISLKSGNPKVLYDNSKATLEIDYSKTMVKKETLKEYLNRRGADFVKDWPDDSKKAREFFIVRFNKKNKNGMQIIETEGKSAPYKIILHVSYLDMGNGGSAFNPWASAKAGGVIMNGTLDIVDVNKNMLVCSMSADDVKGIGHPSETVRLGACYFELATRMLKFAKSYRETGNEKTISYSGTTSNVVAVTKTESGSNSVNNTSKTTAKVNKANSKTAKASSSTIRKKNSVPNEKVSNKKKSNVLLSAKGEVIPRRRKPVLGNFDNIANERAIGVVLYFTDAEIMNRSEDSFVKYMKTSAGRRDLDKDFPETWENDIKPELLSLFCSKVNEELKDDKQRIRLAEGTDFDYVLKIDVLEVDEDGNNIINFLFVNMKEGKVEAQIKCESKGGHVGRFVGLLEQGFESASENFAKTFIDQID